MGDTRSWAADKEDEIVVCRHGNESRYFDKCQCVGCTADRDRNARFMSMCHELDMQIKLKLKDLPEEDWDYYRERILHVLP